MLGNIHFQAKCAEAMNHHYQYDFRNMITPQKRMFKDMCKEVRGKGGNQFDLVTLFMSVMINSVNDKAAHQDMLIRWSLTSTELVGSGLINESVDNVEKTHSALMEAL